MNRIYAEFIASTMGCIIAKPAARGRLRRRHFQFTHTCLGSHCGSDIKSFKQGRNP
jgi:hypothetical protein